MRNPLGFFSELLQQPVWVSAWVFYLMVVNVTSLWFWSEPLAKVVFITFMLSAMLMMGLYSKFGFDKILGMGHVLWIPLLAYVLTELPLMIDDFRNYLILLSISITISLVFDIVDVWKYFSSRESA
ncbi:MAG: hypothetical protein KAJ32_07665 [Gammaproteobacteria bacterium]|nr:hypothetical protein [Gammaproteobacteria bacterium]